jgi:chain length determinant protein EpsF
MVLLLTLIPAMIVTLVMPKTYKATTSMVLNYKGIDPLTGSTKPGQMVSGYLPTYLSTQIDIIKSMTVALRVVDKLKLHESQAMQEAYESGSNGKEDIQTWIADSLLKNLEVKPSRESSVINVSFKSKDPNAAADIANAFADSYQQTSVQLEANPSVNASAYFETKLKKLRDDFEAAQNKVSAYQQENGIANADSRVDVENARLTELSNQLVVAQSQLMEAQSRKAQAQGGRAHESPDVANNPLIQSLKIDISKAQAKLSNIAKEYTGEHPVYQMAKAELDNLRAELRNQTGIASRAVSNNANILARRELELRTAMNDQKNKVMSLNRKRDELGLLTKDMETAQRTYEAVSQRLSQTRIQAQSNQSDVAVLHAADVPSLASGPSMKIMLLIAGFVGLFLGACVAFVCELMDRRIRSARDLEHVIDLPVLATLDAFGTRAIRTAERGLLGSRGIRALPGT